MYLTWNQALETGIPLIDSQHKELFKQVNALLDLENKNRFRETLGFLEKYIAKHFGDEQKLQAESNYPKAAEHKKYHDGFVATFNTLKDNFEKKGDSAVNNIELNNVAAGWLRNHILVHDKEFAAYYKSRAK